MPEAWRFAKFLITGGVAAAVNIASRWLLSAAMPYGAAIAVAYLIGMLTAFVLARAVVFDAPDGAAGQLARFAAVNALAFVQVWLVSVGLARLVFPAVGFGWNAETVAHIIGVLSPVALSYLLHKRFSFRQPRVASG